MTDKRIYQIGLTMINGVGDILARHLLQALGEAENLEMAGGIETEDDYNEQNDMMETDSEPRKALRSPPADPPTACMSIPNEIS